MLKKHQCFDKVNEFLIQLINLDEKNVEFSDENAFRVKKTCNQQQQQNWLSQKIGVFITKS